MWRTMRTSLMMCNEHYFILSASCRQRNIEMA